LGTPWLLVKEIWQRRWRFLIALAGVTLLVSVFVASSIVMVEVQDEVRKWGLGFGYNIFILPRELELDDYYLADFGDASMPAEKVDELWESIRSGGSPIVIARHLTGMLQGAIELQGHKAILTGVMPERDLKPKPGTELEPDEAHLGGVIAELLGLRAGDALTIGAETLRVTQVLPEEGVHEDIRVTTDLGTAQKILGKEGINTIEAESCVCPGLSPAEIAEQLQDRMPDTRAVLRYKIATWRDRVRKHIQTVALVLVSLTLIVGGLAVGGQALAEVRERRREIGMFLAIGVPPSTIAWLFRLKFALLGIVGALLGLLVGHLVGAAVGRELVFFWKPKPFRAAFGFVGPAVVLLAGVLAVGMSLLSSSLAVLKATRLDPATMLREE